jgi:S1-C subfamily serine protease
MSLGVVSAVGRTLEGGGQYRIPDIIQVDAAINRGSSGGVLIDSSGAVLGITTAIQSASGNFEGIGYAIPAHQLKRIVPVLIAQGYYQHAWLGIRMQDNNPQDPNGVYVSDVVSDGPAGRGGIEPGDVIIGMNTNDIRDISDLERTLAAVPVGTLLELTIQRQGTQRMIRVEVGVRPD